MQESRTVLSKSFEKVSKTGKHAGVAMLPSASAASCLTILSSSLLESTTIKDGTLAGCCICPNTYATMSPSSTNLVSKQGRLVAESLGKRQYRFLIASVSQRKHGAISRSALARNLSKSDSSPSSNRSFNCPAVNSFFAGGAGSIDENFLYLLDYRCTVRQDSRLRRCTVIPQLLAGRCLARLVPRRSRI